MWAGPGQFQHEAFPFLNDTYLEILQGTSEA